MYWLLLFVALCYFWFDLVTIRFYPFLLIALMSFLILFHGSNVLYFFYSSFHCATDSPSLSRTYFVINCKKLDSHFWHGFVLLTIFSSYELVTRTFWIILFPSHRITVHARTCYLKLNSKFISPLTKFTFLMLRVSLEHGKLRTTFFNKPTNSHFYCLTTN